MYERNFKIHFIDKISLVNVLIDNLGFTNIINILGYVDNYYYLIVQCIIKNFHYFNILCSTVNDHMHHCFKMIDFIHSISNSGLHHRNFSVVYKVIIVCLKMSLLIMVNSIKIMHLLKHHCFINNNFIANGCLGMIITS